METERINHLAMLISAFPGTGKTFYCENNDDCLDLDSSKFSHCYTTDGIKHKNPNFPDNYVKAIISNMFKDKYRHIFISTHIEVRELLIEYGVPFSIVIPNINRKLEFIGKYKNRNDKYEFIKLIDDNWEDWINELDFFMFQNSLLNGYRLDGNMTISDIK